MFREKGWFWLYPVFYVLHLLDEYFFGEGFHLWFARAGVVLSEARWWILNLCFLALMLLVVFIIQSDTRHRWLGLILAMVALINGIAHILGSLYFGVLSPGILTGTLLWIPLGIFSLIKLKREVSTKKYQWGIILGLIANIMVPILAKIVSVL